MVIERKLSSQLTYRFVEDQTSSDYIVSFIDDTFEAAVASLGKDEVHRIIKDLALITNCGVEIKSI